MSRATVHSVTIASGAATSGATQDMADLTLVGIRTPAEFDGTSVTFTCCDTAGGTYLPLHSADGNAYTVTLAASRYTAVDPTRFYGVRFLKLVASGNQATTDTVVTLYFASL